MAMDVLGGAEKKMAEAVQAAVEHLGPTRRERKSP
jgi:hypothetical protein